VVVLAVIAALAAKVWFGLLATQQHEIQLAHDRAEQRAIQLSEAAAQNFGAILRGVDTSLLYLRQAYLDDPMRFERVVGNVTGAHPPGGHPKCPTCGHSNCSTWPG
jgi:hypothetical protein